MQPTAYPLRPELLEQCWYSFTETGQLPSVEEFTADPTIIDSWERCKRRLDPWSTPTLVHASQPALETALKTHTELLTVAVPYLDAQTINALLSAETALEFLSSEQRANVVLCAAPLVEGALAAAVQASIGADLRHVRDEAQGALAAKISQLAHVDGRAIAPSVTPSPSGDALQLPLVVRNRLGLHARRPPPLSKPPASIRPRSGSTKASGPQMPGASIRLPR